MILTPDDVAHLRKELSDGDSELKPEGQPRQNVLLEAGMALGLDERRTIILHIGKLRPISDMLGKHEIRFDGTAPKRHELVQALKEAKCAADDQTSSEYLTIGKDDFPMPAAV